MAVGLATVGGVGALAQQTIAPGVTYETFSIPGPNQVFVLRVERDRPEYSLHLGWPQGRKNFSIRQKTSEIYAIYDQPPAFDVIAAVNGSFTGDAIPEVVGPHASAGEMQEMPDATRLWETLLMLSNREPRIVDDIAHLSGTLRFANGSKTTLHRYNRRDYQADAITAYTATWGATTGTSNQGIEVVLTDVSYPMRGEKELIGTVAAIHTGAASTNNAIPAGGMVVHARGAPVATITQRVQVGDLLRMSFRTSANDYNNVDFAITGAGWILKDGAACASCWTQWADSFTGINPRTMIGWNSTHLMIVCVDGRQAGYSVGMTFQQMADLMLSLGATDCLNIDGGGSTTMVIDGQVVNSPSDAEGERPRNNAVLLVRKPLTSGVPFRDAFDADGREPGWDDKFNYNAVAALSPAAPGGDGFALHVADPTGGAESVRRGRVYDADYSVEAWVYCAYRPEVAANGFDRTGLFAREAGLAGFGETTYGGGDAYVMTFDSHDGRIRAGKLVDGVLSDFLESSPLLAPSTAWRKMRIDAYGDRLTYWLDNVKIADVVDATHAAGFFGVGYEEFFASNANIAGARVDRVFAYAIRRGDLDCDGVVNFGDIDPFVLALSDPEGFEAAAPLCPLANGDANDDGVVNFSDIDGFVALLGG